MGWTTPYGMSTKKQITDMLIRDLTGSGTHKVLKTATVGNCFWVAMHTVTHGSFIVLYLLEKHKGEYSYKDMDETMHPYYYNCPLSLLDLTTTPTNEELPWRKEVRKRAAQTANRKSKPIAVGDFVTARSSAGMYKVIGRYGPRSWRIEDVATKRVYRCGTSRLLYASILDIPNPAR